MKSNIKEDFSTDFSSFISSFPIAAFVADAGGRIVFSNALWLDATGFSEGEIQNLEQIDRLETHFSHKLTPLFEKLFSFQHPEEMDISVVHKSGLKTTHFKLKASLFRKQYAFFSGIDVSEQVRLSDVLHDKKSQIFSLLNSLGDLVFKIDRNGDILNIWTSNLSDFFPGVNVIQRTNLSDYLPNDLLKSFSAAIVDSISIGHPIDMEFPYQCEGIERWYLGKIAPIQTQVAGQIEEIAIIVREITEERKIRHQIEYKNNLIKQLTSINNGPVLHVIKEDSFRYHFISGNLASLTGHAAEEFSWTDIIHKSDLDYVSKQLQELISNPEVLHRDLVYRIKDNKGNDKWIANYISKANNEGQQVLFGVILNVTEVQLLNNQLKQRDRILTNTTKVAMIGGWEYDVKNKHFNLTDEIYQIHERKKINFDIIGSINHYVEEHRPLIRQHLHDLMSTGKHFDEELQLLTGKGDKKWVRSIGSAEWNSGKITHIYGILQDIDEKKKKDLILQENERRFNAAFELAPVGIGLLSIQGQWLRVNPSLSRFFEFSPNELLQVPINELALTDVLNNPFDWEGIFVNPWNTYQSEEKYQTAKGNVKWGRISISPVNKEDGNFSYFIVQVVDITENKEYEENLILAKKEAEKANKIQSDFLSTMTHEIRTPLYGVIGLTNLLLEEIQDPKYNDHLKALKFSSESLFLLVNDILDFSKIKSGVLSLEQKPFNLKRLVEAIEELTYVRSQEGRNTVVLHYDENLSDQYIGDELRIGQIVNNLVSNAVKFTSNGLIEIKVEYYGELENKQRILFSINDNGIGIPEDIQPFVFDQFIQAEAGTSRKYGGTGLGLPIVKGLLEAMDSQIKLSSELGKGTEVSFELLLEKSKPDLNPSLPKNDDEEIKNLQEKTILLVEDNPVSMMVTHEYIKRWNGNVIQAVNGEEALTKFNENKDNIDLVLMDLQIPILNGYEAAEQINKARPEIPIIALTASLDDKEYSESGKSIMQSFLIKPYVPDELYYMLKDHLQ